MTETLASNSAFSHHTTTAAATGNDVSASSSSSPSSSPSLPAFVLPAFHPSPLGWGPSSTTDLPVHLLGLPFMPFNKGERLSKVADWGFQKEQRGVRVAEEEELQVGEEEGGAFSLVDNKPKVKPKFGYRPQYPKRQQPGTSNPNQPGAHYHNNANSNMHNLMRNKQNVQSAAATGTSHSQQIAAAQQQKAAENAAKQQAQQAVAQQLQQQQQQQQQAQQAPVASPPGGAAVTAWGSGAGPVGKTGAGSWSTAKRTVGQTSAGAQQSPTTNSVSRSRNQQQNVGGRFPNRRGFFNDNKDNKEASVTVNEDWKLVNDIELAELTGVTFEPISSSDLLFAGKLAPFNPAFTRVTPRNPVPAARYETTQFFAASTSEDPILTRLQATDAGTVFATDSILSLLMSSSRSINSWDLLLTKTNGKLIFDKRPSSLIDFYSVNENHADVLSEEADSVNHAAHLAVEATLLNHNFSQQCLLSQSTSTVPSLPLVEFPEPNPFLPSLTAGNEPATVAFRYRKFDLGNGIRVVARTSINAYAPKKSAQTKKAAVDSEEDENEQEEENKSYILTRVLNEFDSKISGGVDWRQKLETQTGAVLAMEMKNNSYKLARFTSEALLSGSDELRLAFISRVNPKNALKHAVLLVKAYSPQNFAESLNVKVKTLWGALKVLLEKLILIEDGSYLLLRDANKPLLHLYKVPPNAFSSDADQTGETIQEE